MNKKYLSLLPLLTLLLTGCPKNADTPDEPFDDDEIVLLKEAKELDYNHDALKGLGEPLSNEEFKTLYSQMKQKCIDELIDFKYGFYDLDKELYFDEGFVEEKEMYMHTILPAKPDRYTYTHDVRNCQFFKDERVVKEERQQEHMTVYHPTKKVWLDYNHSLISGYEALEKYDYDYLDEEERQRRLSADISNYSYDYIFNCSFDAVYELSNGHHLFVYDFADEEDNIMSEYGVGSELRFVQALLEVDNLGQIIKGSSLNETYSTIDKIGKKILPDYAIVYAWNEVFKVEYGEKRLDEEKYGYLEEVFNRPHFSGYNFAPNEANGDYSYNWTGLIKPRTLHIDGYVTYESFSMDELIFDPLFQATFEYALFSFDNEDVFSSKVMENKTPDKLRIADDGVHYHMVSASEGLHFEADFEYTDGVKLVNSSVEVIHKSQIPEIV